MKQLAIIGPTGSGKSDLAIKIALKIDAYILSIDSLSIYKEIDIVSAKPSTEELYRVKHFGINILKPNEYFSVEIFIKLYKEVILECQKDFKNLIIVGGTSFYLKTLLQGLSILPNIKDSVKLTVTTKLKNLEQCYNFLYALDQKYMQKISNNDSYRIEKALLIYEASNMTPTQWFKKNPPIPIIEDLQLFNIDTEKDILRKRITQRTKKMFDEGIVNEVALLEQKYTRVPHAMMSIGIVEIFEYLDAKVSQEKMLNNISTHTIQLAKRQKTFNKTQFKKIVSAPLERLEEIILKSMNKL